MSPHPVDVHVGRRLRTRRTMMGLSQEALGQAVGVTFQQIQKYERGANRMGASRLYEFACILGVSTAYFFEGYLGEGADGDRIPKVGGSSKSLLDYEKLANKEVISLVRSFYDIEEPLVRKRILSLIKSLSHSPSGVKKMPDEDETL